MIAVLLALVCGVDRWPAKTYSDGQGMPRARDALDGTLREQAHSLVPQAYDSRAPRHVLELGLFELTDVWVVAYKLEADSDFHVVIRDGDGTTMVVEFPAPACVKNKAARAVIAQARKQFRAIVPAQPTRTMRWLPVPDHIPVVIGCPPFFDRLHGSVGEQWNGVECHPVHWIRRRR